MQLVACAEDYLLSTEKVCAQFERVNKSGPRPSKPERASVKRFKRRSSERRRKREPVTQLLRQLSNGCFALEKSLKA